jgi:hypothetical protein
MKRRRAVRSAGFQTNSTVTLESQKAIAYVSEWEGKFWITMDQNVKELTEKVENAVKLEMGGEIEKFKAGGQYDKRLSVDKKSELVARVRKVINADQLSELANVIEMLANIDHEGQQKTYYILIDRLDENWVDVSLRVGFESHETRAIRRTSNMTDAT